MTNNKQSSVEWLVKELNQKIDFIPMNKWHEIKEVIEKAKAIHKQEIMTTYKDGRLCIKPLETPLEDEYYNSTFGGNNKQIPTALEFLNRDESGVYNEVDITQAMIEFAKFHVEAALQAASENAQPEYDEGGALGFIDKETVLNAYPLDNIK